MIARQYSDSTQIDVTRDGLGRIHRVQHPSFADPFLDLKWAGADRIAYRSNANGTQEVYGYEAGFGGPVARVAHLRDAEVLWGVDRRFDGCGRSVRERRDHEGATGRALQYDALGRLHIATLGADLHGPLIDDPAPPSSFSHRLETTHVLPGNRSDVIWSDDGGDEIFEQSYTVSADKLNRYTSVGGYAATHDPAGRVNWDESAGAFYRYDYRGRLISVDDDSDFSSPEQVFRYDAEGRRVYEEEWQDGVLQTYTAIIHTPESSEAPLEEHVFDAALVEVADVRYLFGPGGGDTDYALAGVSVNGEWTWRHLDADGSLLGMTSEFGRRVVEYDFLPFGSPVRQEILLDVSGPEIGLLEPGVPTPDSLRIHLLAPPFTPGAFAGREFTISLPNLTIGDKYRTTEVVANDASFIDVHDPAGEIHEALNDFDTGFMVYASRLGIADGAAQSWTYDPLADESTFTVPGAGFTPWVIGGWLVPDTDNPGELEIIDVDPLGEWVRVRGDATGTSSTADHWRVVPPVGVSSDGGYASHLDQRYLYRGMRHDAALRFAASPPVGMNRRGLYGNRMLDSRTGRFHVPGQPGSHPYAFHPSRNLSKLDTNGSPAVPGLR